MATEREKKQEKKLNPLLQPKITIEDQKKEVTAKLAQIGELSPLIAKQMQKCAKLLTVEHWQARFQDKKTTCTIKEDNGEKISTMYDMILLGFYDTHIMGEKKETIIKKLLDREYEGLLDT